MKQVSRLADAIIREGLKYVVPDSVCYEEGENTGKCIDEISKYFNNDKLIKEAYCTSFAWTIIDKAHKSIGLTNRVPKSKGAKNLKDLIKQKNIVKVDSTPREGALFYRKSEAKGSTGHTGLVIEVEKDKFHTVEGNTSFWVGNKSYEGIWIKNYLPSDISKKNFVFMHIQDLDSEMVDYAWNFSSNPKHPSSSIVSAGSGNYTNYGSYDKAGIPIWFWLLLASGGIGYYLANKKQINKKLGIK